MMDKWTRFFHLSCIVITIVLTGWCVYKYTLDEDVSLVTFVKFNDDKQKVYPAFTFCFWNPFHNEKLKTYGIGINTSTYSAYLQGKHWDDRMVSIDYDDVTVSLEDYMTEMGVQYGNFSVRIWRDGLDQKQENIDRPRFYTSNRNGGSKCFSFTMPYIQGLPIVSFFVRINADIFPNGKRSALPNFDGSNISAGGLSTFFHLPGQHFRSYYDKKYSWDTRENKSKNYDMMFTLKNMEVSKHRNKLSNPCNTEWDNDDNMVMEKIMYRAGCRPPHWKLNADLKYCSESEEIKQFKWPSYQDLQKFPLPCTIIEKLQYDYAELDSKDLRVSEDKKNASSWFGVTLFFPEPSYKVIKQAQEYNIENFVGNAGGYIGLFLGYSLMCIPRWVEKMLRKRGTKRSTGKYELNTNRHESSSVTLEICRLEDEDGKEVMEKAIFNVVDVTRLIDQRQVEMEHTVEEIDTMVEVVLPASGMALQSSPGHLVRWMVWGGHAHRNGIQRPG